MSYKLKENENEFQVTREGPFEYRQFRHGVVYDQIPEEEKDLFEDLTKDEGGDEQ